MNYIIPSTLKSIKNTLLLAFVVFAALSCENNAKPEKADQHTDLAAGFNLIEKNCFSCHSPNASQENRVAPPMVAIKKHYINEHTSLDDFTKDLIRFLNNPSEDISKMPQAVKKFNLMPKMGFSEEDITQIAAYIYHTKLEKPNWFDKHYANEQQKYATAKQEKKTPLALGKSFAMQTKSVLGKNLLKAINTQGTAQAVHFCSTKAIPLTDSMALLLNAQIKRVSDNNRNPNNKANEQELAYIAKAKAQLKNKQEITPEITSFENRNIAYYPILTNKMCLQCHGIPGTDINSATSKVLKSIYPNDKAIGYKENELRGIWVVEMDQK